MSTVLVVEDEPDVRFTVRLGLSLAGFTVVEAGTGEDALDLLEHGRPPDVIVLDLRLPGMDGMEVLRRLHDDERLRPVPVIVLSAHASPATAATAIGLGCHIYLTKPVSQDRLRAVVAEAVTGA